MFTDSRDYFFRKLFKAGEFDKTLCPIDFVQDNESCSTLRCDARTALPAAPFTQSKTGALR
ncbi:hypothetical protein [Duncaniella dubosii]|uniref:hypothetical protein n=1 Tax=Duncaniella dubosii TaxID=2518971 RepID=UPI003F665713